MHAKYNKAVWNNKAYCQDKNMLCNPKEEALHAINVQEVGRH